MPQICPKCAYERKPTDDSTPDWQCPACGIAYAKYAATHPTETPATAAPSSTAKPSGAAKPAPPVEPEEFDITDDEPKSNILKIAIPVIVLLILIIYFATRSSPEPEPAIAAAPVAASQGETSAATPKTSAKAAGFEELVWGMDDAEILAKLGQKAERLSAPEIFKNAHADLNIPTYTLGGVNLRVLFQMSNSSNKLSRILLTKNSTDPQQRAFEVEYSMLSAALTKQYGPGKQLGDFKQQWIHGDTVIKLDNFYQEGVFETLTVLYRPYDE